MYSILLSADNIMYHTLICHTLKFMADQSELLLQFCGLTFLFLCGKLLTHLQIKETNF